MQLVACLEIALRADTVPTGVHTMSRGFDLTGKKAVVGRDRLGDRTLRC